MGRLYQKFNNFRGYTKIGLCSNIMFVLFIIVTMIYYSYYIRTGNIIPFVEAIAYTIEVSGFILMAVSVVGYAVKLRFRMLLKVFMALYFLTEFIIMICDFNIIDVSKFYTPASKVLILSHCIFSAFVIMCYLQLETSNKNIQYAVSAAAVISMLASFSIVFNVRVYASVLVNSIAYIVMYTLILFFDSKDMIYVDCHGDVAKVYEDNTFFDDEKDR